MGVIPWRGDAGISAQVRIQILFDPAFQCLIIPLQGMYQEIEKRTITAALFGTAEDKNLNVHQQGNTSKSGHLQSSLYSPTEKSSYGLTPDYV